MFRRSYRFSYQLRNIITNNYEKYNDFSNEKIDTLYAEKENSDFYKNFVAENNKETLAQVFTDIRYSKKNNEFFSEKFLKVLQQQGFLD